MRTRSIGATALLLTLAALAATSTPPHITPTVVLRKQADVIRSTIPEATQFFVKTVRIGQADYRSLSEAGFAPDEAEMAFYYGTGSDGSVVGVVLFPQINTAQHGPVEVGLTLRPDGTIRSAVVTKATIETKPWVQAVEGTDLMTRFVGMRPGSDPQSALESVSRASVGEMPYYVAELIVRDVRGGLALYQTLYAGGAAGRE